MRILFLILMMVGSALSAQFVWDGSTSSDYGVADNFTPPGNPGPIDTVYLDPAISEVACSVLVDMSVGYIHIREGWTGTFSVAERIINFARGISDSGDGGTRDYSNAIKFTMDSSAIWQTKFIPEPAGNNNSLCTLEIKKSLSYLDYIGYAYFCQWKMMPNTQLVTGGGNVSAVRAPNNVPIVMLGGCKLTNTNPSFLQVNRNSSGKFLSTTPTDTIVLTNNIQFVCGASSTSDTLADVAFTGLGTISVQSSSTGFSNNIHTISNLSSPLSLLVLSNNGAPNQRFFAANYNCRGLEVNSTSAIAGRYTHATIAGNDTIGSLRFQTNAIGPDTIDWTNANVSCAGPWTYAAGPNMVNIPNASTITLTGAATVTPNNIPNAFYDLIVASDANTVTIAAGDTVRIATGGDLIHSSGNLVATNAGIIANGDVSFNSAGTSTWPNVLTMAGPTSTLHVESSAGAVTATSCAVTMATSTAGVIDIDKAITYLKSYSQGGNSTVAHGGAAQLYPRFMAFGDNARLTINSPISVYPDISGAVITCGDGVVFDGINAVNVVVTTNNLTISLPAITLSGTGLGHSLNLLANANGTVFNFSGNISMPGNHRFYVYGAKKGTVNTNGFSLACANLNQECSNATDTSIYNFGASAVTVQSMAPASSVSVTTGLHLINMGSSQWTVAGNWTNGINHTVSPDSSTVTFTGTGLSRVIPAGKSFGNFVCAKTGTAACSLGVADTLRVAKLRVTSGVLKTIAPVNVSDSLIASVDVTFPNLVMADAADVLVATGKTITLSGIYDIEGSAGNLVTWSGGTLALPAVDTVSYMRWTGVTAAPSTIIANNGTNVDGNGNTNIFFVTEPAFFYPSSPAVDTVGKIASHSVTSTGGTIDSFTVLVGIFPDGMSLDKSTGAIGGTPLVITPPFVIIIQAHNAIGITTAPMSIEVVDAPISIGGEWQSFNEGLGLGF